MSNRENPYKLTGAQLFRLMVDMEWWMVELRGKLYALRLIKDDIDAGEPLDELGLVALLENTIDGAGDNMDEIYNAFCKIRELFEGKSV